MMTSSDLPDNCCTQSAVSLASRQNTHTVRSTQSVIDPNEQIKAAQDWLSFIAASCLCKLSLENTNNYTETRLRQSTLTKFKISNTCLAALARGKLANFCSSVSLLSLAFKLLAVIPSYLFNFRV